MVVYEGITENEVALTFDDGPNPQITPKILKVLKDKGVKATFFLIGRRAEESPETVRLIISEGHDVGNHSYSHADGGLPLVQRNGGDQAVIGEITRASNAIKRIAGITDDELRFYRPQGMLWNDEYGKLAKPYFGDNIIKSDVGSTDYNWNRDTHIWKQDDAENINIQMQQIIDDVKSHAKSGSIICLHDSAEYCLPGTAAHTTWMNRALPTLQALPTIIDDLQAKGFVIKKLSEMNLKKESIRPN